MNDNNQTATLDDVDIRAELRSRPSRAPGYEAEHRALAALAAELAENPRNMLQRLTEVAVELCGADTAGVSILEGDTFRWEALAGVFGSRRNDRMPTDASPCGVCLERNSTQLMYLADRRFPALLADPRFVEALLVPFHEHGVPIGTVWIVAHNYERKFDREDERIIRSLAQFASAGWQLWRSYQSEAESSKKKDEFVAMLGHELRNPLAAILSANDVLSRTIGDNPDAMQGISIVARQGKHLLRMVEDLIDVSRINLGKMTLDKRPIELGTSIAHAVETTSRQIEHRRQWLSVVLPNEPVWLEGDGVRLAQLWANLLDNAAKYTPEGGEIQLSTSLDHDHVSVTVRDNGIGIAREQLDHIFVMFDQGSIMSAAPGGLGLGLALVRTLAELHGGKVEAASDGLGKGSVFTVRLPILATRSIGAEPEQGVDQTQEQADRKILLVEDNEDVAESLAAVLAMDGHLVKIATNGANALDILHRFDPDVVLLDIGLPDIEGYEVARRMRREHPRKERLIVALSGYGQLKDRDQSKAAGCDEHLVKPARPEDLRRVIMRAQRA
ncbi:MAG: Autoinducer 2 sensor kinase/phosphatase LuxQ [Candidatus Binatus sp.]|nr:Autoinducer 2 sensor kinase/phosphatase LuxQ [Candidatus Binatus sp.]